MGHNSVYMQIKTSKNIVPVSDFKALASDWLRRVAASGQPLVITQHGKAAGVLLSPEAFDQLMEQTRFLGAVQEGLTQAAAGDVLSTEEVFDRLEQNISSVESNS